VRRLAEVNVLAIQEIVRWYKMTGRVHEADAVAVLNMLAEPKNLRVYRRPPGGRPDIVKSSARVPIAANSDPPAVDPWQQAAMRLGRHSNGIGDD